MRKTFIAAGILVMLSSPAFAFSCPTDMAAIDKALAAMPMISDTQKAEVMKYRAEGEALHKAGDHAKSLETLAKAKAILGIM